MDESATGIYDMILGRYLITSLILILTCSNHVIDADGGTFKESTEPIVDLGTYEFEDLSTEKIIHE